jgi:YegS/Rv2252/BmrU family lipid kinase
MKEAIVIYNPHSGRRKIRRELEKCERIFAQHEYQYMYIKTEYRGHARELLETTGPVDLVITLGGDGTFNEAVTGNLRRERPLVLSHIPVGTTNDLGAIFGLGNNITQNLRWILDGEQREIDICTINGSPFVYAGGFGKFMNVAYETPRAEKKRWGYVAYALNTVKDFLFRRVRLYDIEYEVNGEKYRVACSFALISNANRIAGIKYPHKDVKLNDGQFEVLLCGLRRKQEILGSGLFTLAGVDITKSVGWRFFKTNWLKIHFNEALEKPWCLDGEKYESDMLDYEIKTDRKLKMLLPKRATRGKMGWG